MILTKEDILLNEYEKYYLLIGDIKVNGELKIELDKPLFISGSLKVFGNINSLSSINCDETIECDELYADGMSIKSKVINCNGIKAKTIDILSELNSSFLECIRLYNEGKVYIGRKAKVDVLVSSGYLNINNITCNIVNSKGFVTFNGFSTIESFEYNGKKSKYERTVSSGNKIETIFSDYTFKSEKKDNGKIDNNIIYKK